MRHLIIFFLSASSLLLCAQSNNSTSSQERISSVNSFDQNNSNSQLNALAFDNIGPTVFSGRVTDIEVDPEDPTHFYVAYASGGLWETHNNGTSFNPIFDHEVVMTIGDVAVDWTTNTIWLGSGEVNSSRSSYSGVGVFKSTDGGTTWALTGLPESHHIGKIIVHPTDPLTAWVAVLGHLYTDNTERGVYKTTDGGATWNKTLFVNNKSGAVDMIIDPSNPSILYTAIWHRERKAWNFTEAGAGSGIYKSNDGGDSWKLLSGGFPSGDGTGRIGLAIGTVDGVTRIYALLDNYNRRPKKENEKTDDLTKEDLRSISVEKFAQLDSSQLEKFLRSNNFPKEHNAKSIFQKVANKNIVPNDLVSYLETANSLLFDTPVIGAELYFSDDGGRTWHKTHEDYLDGVYYSYGYYFGVVSVDPTDLDKVYIAGVPILKSSDKGATFKSINGDNVHVDHHRIWINPRSPNHIINGNDGGINISYDSGENWIKCNTPAVGQFYYINTDNAKPYNVYGGIQDNGVWKGSHDYKASVRWHNSGKYPYQSIIGGDGMQVQIDSRDNTTLYTGFQFGNYFRINTATKDRKRITPKHKLGDRPYRWNWQTPIHLSTHNEDILYMGGNKLFRSMDQGNNFDSISEDLTKGGRKGDVAYGTLATVHESSLRFGLIYTGSDDGLVHVTKDGGSTWQNCSTTLPKDFWVSRVQASSHEEARVFISLNGYRTDDFRPYVYMSNDYGQTWTNINANLPNEPVNVIKEDPHHENILYIGTDRGVYVSLDQGKSYERFDKSLPSVPVHDIVVQAAAKDLLIGTHGRSIYKADLSPIYALSEFGQNEILLVDIADAKFSSAVGKRRGPYAEYRKTEINYVVFSPQEQEVSIEISIKGEIVFVEKHNVKSGLNYLKYNTSVQETKLDQYKSVVDKKDDIKAADDGIIYLNKGGYLLNVRTNNKEVSKTFKLK